MEKQKMLRHDVGGMKRLHESCCRGYERKGKLIKKLPMRQ